MLPSLLMGESTQQLAVYQQRSLGRAYWHVDVHENQVVCSRLQFLHMPAHQHQHLSAYMTNVAFIMTHLAHLNPAYTTAGRT